MTPRQDVDYQLKTIITYQAASRDVFGLTDVACDGTEASLGECLHRFFGINSCGL